MSIWTDSEELCKVVGKLDAITKMQNEYFNDYIKAEYDWQRVSIQQAFQRLLETKREAMEVFENEHA